MIKLQQKLPQNILTRNDEIHSPNPTVKIVNTLGRIVVTVGTLGRVDNVQGLFSELKNIDIDVSSWCA